MVQFVCDRCGCIMKPYDAAHRICSHIEITDATLENDPHKYISPLWDESEQHFDICPDCRASFNEWMKDGKRHGN